MALGGRAVDGSETGWDRSAEPAPRWRALLDRARLGSRGQDRGDDQHRGAPERRRRRARAPGHRLLRAGHHRLPRRGGPRAGPLAPLRTGVRRRLRLPARGALRADPRRAARTAGRRRRRERSRRRPGSRLRRITAPAAGADRVRGYGADPAAGYGDRSAPRGGYGPSRPRLRPRGRRRVRQWRELSSRGYGSSRYAELGSLSDGYRDPAPEPTGVSADRYSRSAAPAPATLPAPLPDR